MPRRKTRVRNGTHPYGVLTPVVAAHALAIASPHAAASLSNAIVMSVDPGTLSNNESARASYTKWCAVRRLRPWPCDEILLAAWCVHLGTSCGVPTIQGYASSIKFVHPLNCAEPWPCDGSVIVRQAFRDLPLARCPGYPAWPLPGPLIHLG